MSKIQFDQYIQDFLDYLEIERNRSLRTIRNYKFYIERFRNWLEENDKVISLKSINLVNLRAYRKWLNRLVKHDNEIIKKNTQNYHLIALRSWLKYLAKQDIEVLKAIHDLNIAIEEIRHQYDHDNDFLSLVKNAAA